MRTTRTTVLPYGAPEGSPEEGQKAAVHEKEGAKSRQNEPGRRFAFGGVYRGRGRGGFVLALYIHQDRTIGKRSGCLMQG